MNDVMGQFLEMMFENWREVAKETVEESGVTAEEQG